MKTLKLFYPATKGRTRRAFGFRRLPLEPQRSSSAPASPRVGDAGGSLNATIAVQECSIGPLEARGQERARPPSHGGELRAVEKFARHAIGTRGIEHQFAARFAGPPNRDRGCSVLLRFMKTPDQSCDHVAVLWMIIVARAVNVG